MPRSCCVPGCDGIKPTFVFPENSVLRDTWLTYIGLKNYTITNNSAVCVKHFEEEFVIRTDKVRAPDGSIVEFPRKLLLAAEAIPTIFPNQPSEQEEAVPQERKDAGDRKIIIVQGQEKIQWNGTNLRDSSINTAIVHTKEPKYRKEKGLHNEQYIGELLKKDRIKGFRDLKKHVGNRSIEPFCVVDKPRYLLLCKFEDGTDNKAPALSTTIKIWLNLRISVFHKGVKVPDRLLKSCLTSKGICNRWSKFDMLMKFVKTLKDSEFHANSKLSMLMDWFSDIDLTNCEDDIQCRLIFMREQLRLTLFGKDSI